MLQGLDQTMTEDGLIDLVAYLDSMEQALATVQTLGRSRRWTMPDCRCPNGSLILGLTATTHSPALPAAEWEG